MQKRSIPQCLGFPGGSDSKESARNTGDLDSGPGLGRSPREGKSYPLQYSCLENSTDRGAWRATVHEIAKSQTQLKWLSTLTHSNMYQLGADWLGDPHTPRENVGRMAVYKTPSANNVQDLTGEVTRQQIIMVQFVLYHEIRIVRIIIYDLTLGLPWCSDGKASACNTGAWVWALGREDPLEKGMATHSNILTWRIPRTEESGGLRSRGWQRVRHKWGTHTHHYDLAWRKHLLLEVQSS